MIHVFYEDCSLSGKQHEDVVSKMSQVIENEGFKEGDLSVVFCSDTYLLEINKAHLDHDYYTDILTFSYNENNLINGDLFISVDRLKENAEVNNVEFLNELSRVVIHGVLHLCGYNDKTPEEITLMREKESDYLKRICFT
jgi:rRNA maturation RNase YbeY